MERDGRVIKIYNRDSLLKAEIESKCHHMCYISSLTTTPDKPPKIGKPAYTETISPMRANSPTLIPSAPHVDDPSSTPSEQDTSDNQDQKAQTSGNEEEKAEESSLQEKGPGSPGPQDQADKSGLESKNPTHTVVSLDCPEPAESRPDNSLWDNPNVEESKEAKPADQICNGEQIDSAPPEQDSSVSEEKHQEEDDGKTEQTIQCQSGQEKSEISASKDNSGEPDFSVTKPSDDGSLPGNRETPASPKDSIDTPSSPKQQSESISSPKGNLPQDKPVPVGLPKAGESESIEPLEKTAEFVAPKVNQTKILLPDEVYIPSDSEIHIAESCRYCHEVRLYNIESLEAFAVFPTATDIKPTRVCGGPSKTVFVYIGDDNILQLKLNVEDTVVEQVSSFTVPVTKAVTEMHYVPRQDILVIADYDGGEVVAVKLNTKHGLVKHDAVCEAVWRLGGTGMEIEGSKMWPYDICGNDDGSLIYITDDFNERLLSLDPRFGQMQQVTFEEDYGYIHHVMFFNTQPHLAVHHHKTKISCFALQY